MESPNSRTIKNLLKIKLEKNDCFINDLNDLERILNETVCMCKQVIGNYITYENAYLTVRNRSWNASQIPGFSVN